MGTADDRHSTGRNTRGPARPDQQLGRVQRKVLRWLLHKTLRVELRGSEYERHVLRDRGVQWKDGGAGVHVALMERPSAVSEALQGSRGQSLERRKLVKVTRSKSGQTTHVALTAVGRERAELLVGEGSPQSRAEIEQYARRFCEEVGGFGPQSEWTNPEWRTYYELADGIERAYRRLGGAANLFLHPVFTDFETAVTFFTSLRE